MAGLSSIFATLTPSNVAAKIDFDKLIENSGAQLPPNVHCSSKKTLDREIFRFRKSQIDRSSQESDCGSVTSTEYATEPEDEGGWIHTGHYALDLAQPPNEPLIGWRIGKDLKLGLTYKAERMRSCPATLNFHHNDTGFLSLLSRVRTGGSEIAVNGVPIDHGNTFSLNQNPMQIRLGPLHYEFSYTTYATGPQYTAQRNIYFEIWLRERGPMLDIAPTPVGHVRTFGQWTMNGALGKGSLGRVHVASNAKGHVVAIKVMDGKKPEVHQEIEILQRLRPFASAEPCEGRLLRLVEVIRSGQTESRTVAPFEDVAVVLEPCVSTTFARLCTPTECAQ